MLSLYNLIIDVVAMDKTIDEEQFREQIEPCLSYLHALKGAFGSTPCTITYYHPYGSPLNVDTGFWSARVVVMLSVGKKRGANLLKVYEGMGKLLAVDLPECEVRFEIGQIDFS